MIDEILNSSPSVEATKSLIATKIDAPHRRVRNELKEIRFGTHKGQLNVSTDKMLRLVVQRSDG